MPCLKAELLTVMLSSPPVDSFAYASLFSLDEQPVRQTQAMRINPIERDCRMAAIVRRVD